MRRGLPAHAFDGRPHIAIANTASDLTPCNAHLNEVAESVKQGVYEAGGIPLNLPVVSLGETLVRPTAMLWRNMAAMAIEEMLRANPIDGVVLLGGCDKTIPALLMAAASVDLPAVVVPGGPMLTGTFRGQPLGCGTDVWRLSRGGPRGHARREEQFLQSESSMIRSRGHCNTMGTASTMGLLAEALGHGAARARRHAGRRQPAARARRTRPGRLAVEMVARGDRARARPHARLVPQRHRRAGRDRRLDQRGRAPARDRRPARRRADARTTSTAPARRCRCWSTCSPPGRFLMEDFFRAGGLHAVLREVRDLLDPTALTVTGGRSSTTSTTRRSGTARSSGRAPSRCSRTPASPCCTATSRPDGAVIKPAAASPHLLSTAAGPWSSTRSRTCTPASTTPTSTSTPTRCWCCAAAARRAIPACPRSPTCRCRPSCCEQGVRDMVRICDGRMSGTAYGTVVLHVAPEAAAGGPLALVRTGDHRRPRRRGPAARRRHPARGARRAGARRGNGRRLRRTRDAAGSGSTSSTVQQAEHRRRPRLPASGPAAPESPANPTDREEDTTCQHLLLMAVRSAGASSAPAASPIPSAATST